MVEIAREAVFGSVSTIFKIAIIVIPLMVAMQLLKDYKILDRFADTLRPITDFFGMSKEASFPLLIGLVFGISYGAGAIVQSSREGSLTKRDITLVVLFLVNCHAVIEDTLVFVAVGANGFILLGSRLLAAVILTYVMSKWLDRTDPQFR